MKKLLQRLCVLAVAASVCASAWAAEKIKVGISIPTADHGWTGGVVWYAKKAVEELDAQGVTTFCLSLDPGADSYVSEIFGQRWRVLDRIERLPEQLPMLYLSLTR